MTPEKLGEALAAGAARRGSATEAAGVFLLRHADGGSLLANPTVLEHVRIDGPLARIEWNYLSGQARNSYDGSRMGMGESAHQALLLACGLGCQYYSPVASLAQSLTLLAEDDRVLLMRALMIAFDGAPKTMPS